MIGTGKDRAVDRCNRDMIYLYCVHIFRLANLIGIRIHMLGVSKFSRGKTENAVDIII